MAPDHKIQSLILKITFMLRGASPLAWMIPAEVPRQARDPERVERAGIQGFQEVLDPGACPGLRSGIRRGDGFGDFTNAPLLTISHSMHIYLYQNVYSILTKSSTSGGGTG